jgi:hypothetical protein
MVLGQVCLPSGVMRKATLGWPLIMANRLYRTSAKTAKGADYCNSLGNLVNAFQYFFQQDCAFFLNP